MSLTKWIDLSFKIACSETEQKVCLDCESNTGPQDLQSCALPTELSRHLLTLETLVKNIISHISNVNEAKEELESTKTNGWLQRGPQNLKLKTRLLI